jgi:hypothetical protein
MNAVAAASLRRHPDYPRPKERAMTNPSKLTILLTALAAAGPSTAASMDRCPTSCSPAPASRG